MSKYAMSFSEWLHQPEPTWKYNLERCHPMIFEELKISKENLEKILEKLDEYEIFESVAQN